MGIYFMSYLWNAHVDAPGVLPHVEVKALILHPHVLALRQLALKNEWFKNGSQSLVIKVFTPKMRLRSVEKVVSSY
jgi:hypothetical protein